MLKSQLNFIVFIIGTHKGKSQAAQTIAQYKYTFPISTQTIYYSTDLAGNGCYSFTLNVCAARVYVQEKALR